jgi:hypothetical protein
MLTKPNAFASLKALRTVVSETPARAAIWPMVREQLPPSATLLAITANTACSAPVNLFAILGGIRPEAAQERLRSIEAVVLGLDPQCRCTGFPVAGMAFLTSISSDSSDASASVT